MKITRIIAATTIEIMWKFTNNPDEATASQRVHPQETHTPTMTKSALLLRRFQVTKLDQGGWLGWRGDGRLGMNPVSRQAGWMNWKWFSNWSNWKIFYPKKTYCRFNFLRFVASFYILIPQISKLMFYENMP